MTITSGPSTLKKRARPRIKVPVLSEYQKANGFFKMARGTAVLTDWNRGGGRIELNARLEVGDWINLGLKPQSAQLAYVPSGFPLNSLIRGRVVCEVSPVAGAQETELYTYGVAFALYWKSVCHYFFQRLIPWIASFLFMAGTINVLYLKNFNIYYFWYHPLFNFYSLMISVYILSRFLLAYFYQPPPDTGHLPPVTVVIACKNEEDSIRHTVECVYQSDYPRDKLEVITVDDGSTDRTLEEMQRTQLCHEGLKIIHFEQNRGKRHGMAEGARNATGEILVFIDSDSFVRRDAIRKLVQGFVDPDVGAVCGHANVQNARTNLLTKMQEVRYFAAFRVVKAAESLFSAVTCCSGCLAAYRRSYVMEVLETWLNQKFLGKPATFGDDRSLTNFMLRRYRVIYHSEAVCTTLVPETYTKFFRQQLRWKKSWIRESLIASTFLWLRHPLAAFFFYLGVVFPLASPFIVFNAFLIPFLGYGDVSYVYVYGAILMSALYGLCYLAQYRSGMWIFGILYSLFYMLILVWQTYYALLTVRRNHWGTR
ncbi:MAG: glycosyltransferase [Nitrospira sp.]|nr:glycosyltransferase [Nitrospira sp.]